MIARKFTPVERGRRIGRRLSFLGATARNRAKIKAIEHFLVLRFH
jgi:hypothetical protein